jgi:hypothetical protein
MIPRPIARVISFSSGKHVYNGWTVALEFEWIQYRVYIYIPLPPSFSRVSTTTGSFPILCFFLGHDTDLPSTAPPVL